MKRSLIAMLLIGLAGCASRPPVNCDWRLKPINAPAPVENKEAEAAGATEAGRAP
jgi:type IV pilus biogenesis protein CpaD/CtpE